MSSWSQMDVDNSDALVATTSTRFVPITAMGSSAPTIVLPMIGSRFVPNVRGSVLTTTIPLDGVATMSVVVPIKHNEKPEKFKRWQ